MKCRALWGVCGSAHAVFNIHILLELRVQYSQTSEMQGIVGDLGEHN